MTLPAPPKSALFIVWLAVFIDLLGFGIVLPLLPRYAGDYLPAVPEAARGAVLGLLYSIFSLMQFVFSPVWGRVSDRVGRRPILILGLAGSVVFYALFGLASTLPPEQAWLALGLLFFSRLGAGVAGASVSTAVRSIVCMLLSCSVSQPSLSCQNRNCLSDRPGLSASDNNGTHSPSDRHRPGRSAHAGNFGTGLALRDSVPGASNDETGNKQDRDQQVSSEAGGTAVVKHNSYESPLNKAIVVAAPANGRGTRIPVPDFALRHHKLWKRGRCSRSIWTIRNSI